MTLIAVSTIVRGAAPGEQSSYLRLVDLELRRVLAVVVIPESKGRATDPNARGGHRGCRGVSGLEDRFVVASNDRLFVLDPLWRLLREISHPWMGGIHDVLAVNDGIWVNSTAASLLLKMDWQGNLTEHWHWATDSELAGTLGFSRPPQFDESIDYRDPVYGLGVHDVIHLNAVIARGGGLVLSFGQIRSPAIQRLQRARSAAMRVASVTPILRQLVAWLRGRRISAGETRGVPAPGKRGAAHAIVELELAEGRPGPARVLWRQDEVSTPKHNVGFAGRSLLFNDSEIGLAMVDPDTGEVELTIQVPGSPTFARGLCMLSDDELWVGSQCPAAIHRLGLQSGSVIDSIELGAQPLETVYAICAVPEAFSQDRFDGFAEWTSEPTV